MLRVEEFGADRVARWGMLTADTNPLHTDVAFAATTVFGVPIVHGHLVACSVLDAVQEKLGDDLTRGGGISVRFLAPVPVGQTAELRWNEEDDLIQVACVDTGQVQVEAFFRRGERR
jgi:acyl dehydratase